MPTSNARIGYINLLENGAVVASSEDANNPVENAYDWLTSDFFSPASPGTINIDLTLSAPASADYFAFYNQDLHSLSGTIKLQYWDGVGYVDCFSAIAPADNRPQMTFFASQTSDKWRVVIACASVFTISAISFGPVLALQYGMYLNWTPPLLARATRLINSVSDGGSFLGRSIIGRGINTTLQLQYATDAWVRSDWLPFVKHAEKKPFFFAPDIVAYPADVTFCWSVGDIAPPAHTHYGFMGASLNIEGLIE